MAIKNDILTLLRTDVNVGYLNFQMRGFHVRWFHYQAIAGLIEKGKIKIIEGKVQAGAAAEYDDRSDTIRVPKGFKVNNLQNKAYIIHECTHAIFDFQNMGKHDGILNEACCYVAGIAYYAFKTLQIPPLEVSLNSMSLMYLGTAVSLGDYNLPMDEIDQAMADVKGNSLYKNVTTYGSNSNW